MFTQYICVVCITGFVPLCLLALDHVFNRHVPCLQLMGEEPDLDPEITKDFLEQNILQFDPSLLTENGMK